MSVSFLLEYSRRTVTPFPAVPTVLTHTCAALVCSAVPSTWVFVRWLFADCLCTLKPYQGTGDFTSSCPALAPSLWGAFPPLLAALTKQGFAQAQKRKRLGLLSALVVLLPILGHLLWHMSSFVIHVLLGLDFGCLLPVGVLTAVSFLAFFSCCHSCPLSSKMVVLKW